ncbi:MAG: S8 family serine peptidase [Wenzhouxiangella sp.]
MYADDEQFWVIGNGQLQGGAINFTNMVTARGTGYGPSFDPGAVETLPFGNITVDFADCNEALFRFNPVLPGFPPVDLPMQRLIPVSCSQGTPSPSNARSAGTWFNPARNGEGFQLTVEGNQDLHVLAFYTFLDGEQAWLIGPGTRAGNRIVFDVIVTFGTGFGPQFNAAEVVTIPAGTITMDFHDCNTATIRTQSTLQEFPNIETEVIKIIHGICESAGAETFVFEPQDPYLFAQWHLFSDGQPIVDFLPAPALGADLNLLPLWLNCPISGCQGKGVVVAVVDDGLEIRHPDLIDNVAQNIPHRDMTVASNAPNQDPSPFEPDDGHGTAVGGLIAARDNDIGVVGVASRATLVGINLLKASNSVNNAAAMVHARNAISVSNNSWGAADGFGFLNPSEQTWKQAIELGISQGADGRGIVYLWAGGNGHTPPEDGYFSDFSGIDGKANFHGVLAIAAANADDRRSSYSELGSNLLVTGFGGEFCGLEALTMATADLSTEGWGYNNEDAEQGDTDFFDRRFTRCFNGTSAATPTVAGVVALIREANPSLTWRDVRWVLAHTARQIDPNSDNWFTNGAGLTYNWEYGFGAADAAASVQAARTMTRLPPYRSENSARGQTGTIQAGSVLSANAQFNSSQINRVEFVTAHVRIEGGADDFDSGDLFITLTSPSGVTALLTPNRRCTEEDPETEEELWVFCENSIDFSFGSVQFLGENPNGTWRLRVDAENSPQPASLTDWSVTIHGHQGN